jgi:cytochrome c oxidase assembly factor CtaG
LTKLLADIALVAVSAALTWPVVVWLLGDRLWAATVRLSVAVAVCAPLVAVSVWLVTLCAPVGEPEINPLLVFKLRPAGRAGLML